MANKKKGIAIFLIIALLVVLLVAIYFTWFFSYKCNDLACYVEHQKDCSPTKFVNNAEDVTWKYFILGKEKSRCEVEVTALQVKQGTVDKKVLQDKSMVCSLGLGNAELPDSDLSKCSGELKEEMQNLIIQNLHKYIVDNLGEIGEELESV